MTTTEDLYQQADETYVEYTRRAALTLLERAGLRAVVDLALAARPERQQWEVLREAREIAHANGVWINDTAVSGLAATLEAVHRAAQEKAEREAEREKLIEQAAFIVAATRDHGPDRTVSIQDRQMAEGLLAAGLLSAPESDGGAA